MGGVSWIGDDGALTSWWGKLATGVSFNVALVYTWMSACVTTVLRHGHDDYRTCNCVPRAQMSPTPMPACPKFRIVAHVYRLSAVHCQVTRYTYKVMGYVTRYLCISLSFKSYQARQKFLCKKGRKCNVKMYKNCNKCIKLFSINVSTPHEIEWFSSRFKSAANAVCLYLNFKSSAPLGYFYWLLWA